MDLQRARELKKRVRHAASASGFVPFATGIGILPGGEYRVNIQLTCEADRQFLSSEALSDLLHRRRSDIQIEVAGAPTASTSEARNAGEGSSVLHIGASVGHDRGGVGSLCFFAVRRADRRVGLVSCNHVIAMGDEGRDGDAIVAPSHLDGTANVIASLDGSYPRLANRSGGRVDCAFAALMDGVAYDDASVPDGRLSPAVAEIAKDMEVTTAGRVTRGSSGVIHAIEVDDVWVRYGTTRVAFHNVVQIGSADGQRFCRHGDSGALVYTTRTFQPVGLLFATSAVGGPHDAGLTWVHPIQQVMDVLGVDLTCESMPAKLPASILS